MADIEPTLVERLRLDLARVQADGRELPWEVQNSCSFRRIGTAARFGDGNVLSAYNQRGDNHPDLSMPEDDLFALIRLVNAIPEAADTIEALLAERRELVEALREVRACRKRVNGETVHGFKYDSEAWSISGLTALLPTIDTLLSKHGEQ